MNNNRPFIKSFKTAKGHYIYDCGKNEILSVSKESYNDLSGNNSNDNQEILNLLEQGYLSSETFKEVIHPATEIAEYLYSNSFTRVILQITQQCNLQCLYCPYSANMVDNGYVHRSHDNKIMSSSVAKKAVDFLINNSRNSEKVMISFYGGEPLLQFNLVKETIEYAKKKGEGKEKIFTITTNATLISEEIMDYFIENKVLLTISIDGPKEIHDKNRKSVFGNFSSFDKVIDVIKKFREKNIEYLDKITFSTVIDPMIDFKKSVEFFNNNEYVKDIKLISTIITSSYKTTKVEFADEFQNDYRYEKFKLLLAKSGHLNKKHIPRLLEFSVNELKENIEDKLTIKTKMIPDKIFPAGVCVPGLARVLVDVNGNFFICEKANENSEVTKFGDVYNGVNIEKIKKLLNIGKITEDKCKSCWAIRFCRACALGADDGENLSKLLRIKNCNEQLKNADNLIRDYLLISEIKREEIIK